MGRVRWIPTIALLFLIAGCDADLEDAYDQFRSNVPPICKDYCEERVACERETGTGPSDDSAFTVQVHHCVVQCGSMAVEGAHIWRQDSQALYERYYDGHIPGETLIAGFECLYRLGAYRCVQTVDGFVHRLNAPVQSLCLATNGCIADYHVDEVYFWRTDTTEIGGYCARSGLDRIDAMIF